MAKKAGIPAKHSIAFCAAVQRWLTAVAPAVGLPHMEFRVEREHADPDCHAEVMIFEQQVVRVWLAEGFANLSSEEQRRVLAHEMGHAWLASIEAFVEAAAKPMAKTAGRVLVAQYAELEEVLAERFARLVHEHLPLPSFPT